ncbi:MAG: DUF3737 family protein [Bacteroidales bacterium]|nr:DUF3737 family protein [Bacteroidales bacterium]
METIKNKEFGGERPLFGAKDLILENVTIHAGESALKECSNIRAVACVFEGKYPFWHVNNFQIEDCLFREGARAALWYSSNLLMTRTLVEAPKMFREMSGLVLDNVQIPDAQETLWHCRDIKLRDVKVKNADYIFMHCNNIDIENYEQHGNYSFQYCNDVEIRNAVIFSKDAFWNTNNVTVRDSELHGEYLGWHSHNLHLINCKISGTQPLCYCHNLIMENCEFAPDCDLAFEESELNAVINSPITSVKNPTSGIIKAKSYGSIILDEFIKQPADCLIEVIE